MANADGIIVGGRNETRGYHDGSRRGYPLELGLSTTQVCVAVTHDLDIFRKPLRGPPTCRVSKPAPATNKNSKNPKIFENTQK